LAEHDEDGHEVDYTAKAHRCFHNAARRLVNGMLSNSRIQAVCLYYKKILKQNMSKKLGASKIYLTESQYLQVRLQWMAKCEDAYKGFCKYWALDEFKEKSNKKRSNREFGDAVLHHYGADGHMRPAKQMAS
jgi:hypothetical protein